MNNDIVPSAALLWCIRLLGADDIHAAASRKAAHKMADGHNAAVRKMIARRPDIIGDGITEDSIRAVVEPWPWSAESHAADIARAALASPHD